MVQPVPQAPPADLATSDRETEAQIVVETRTGSGQVQSPHTSHTALRLSLRQTDDGLAVAIFAERPETLDLLRRNIDLLARDFLDIGYESAEFTFGRENPAPGDRRDNTDAALHIGPTSDADNAPPRATAIHLGDRLDIRL
jgi:hypothetical protein